MWAGQRRAPALMAGNSRPVDVAGSGGHGEGLRRSRDEVAGA
ncbi:hypothetical protein I552_1380 [Mycobacterium xenopi 3993]|nr:hypothetical protein I552_0596 [Mycobacterium xenopi 3993]EUA50444.1 hypothetical protein I552_1380 [Mycobacterium xenopi 3993]